MTTKHDQIIQHIQELEIGTRISVRRIAQDMEVSEGTAYRAIKDAETHELVKTLPRAGTIRIAKLEKKNIERLSFSEVVSIVDGIVLGGHNGLDKSLTKFVIGAMTVDAMGKYLSTGGLIIVGNREEVHNLALENGCAVLITGGFGCSERIKELANQKGLPIISSTYDTFTIATMINKAISERMIKKEILLVEDIMVVNPKYLTISDDITSWKTFFSQTGHSRYPVVDQDMQVVGIITPKDIADAVDGAVSSRMTTNPVTVDERTTVAYAAHIMIWEGIELLPVVRHKKLSGVVSRQDVIKALQYMRNQPQVGETLEDIILSGFESTRLPNGMQFTGRVSPLLLSHIGTASWSSMTMLMSTSGIIALRKYKQWDVVVDSFTVYFVHPVQMDDKLDITVEIFEEGRNVNKVEIVAKHDKDMIAKAMLSSRTMRR